MQEVILMCQVKIERMDDNGRGIGTVNGKIVFVAKAIPGEIVEIEILKEKSKYLEGKIVKVLQSSPKRVTPKCPYYELCGGCDLEHLSYEDGLEIKQNMLENLFRKNGLGDRKIPIERMEQPWNYRNKISLKVVDGQIGFFQSETHQLVPISWCAISRSSTNRVLQDFSSFFFHNGEIVIRTNDNDEILMDIITQEKVSILKEFPEHHKIAGILVNHHCVYGKPYFFERRAGVLYQVSMNSFFQVNSFMSEKLFEMVRNALKGARNVLDLYCGVGTLGLLLAKDGVSITGIEVVPSAVLNAIKNAKLNHVLDCSYHLGKVEDILKQIPKTFDAVILDPPRSGLDQKTRETVLQLAPASIIYISCNPMTLVRDLKELVLYYDIEVVNSFDMFAYTKHVETVCCLSRKCDI